MYPALAVAQHIKLRFGDAVSCEFAGSRDRMEWDLVPKEGFKVHPVPAVGLRRPLHSLKNLLLPFRCAHGLLLRRNARLPMTDGLRRDRSLEHIL